MKNKLIDVFTKLDTYVIDRNYYGYDPYDALNGIIPFERLGRMPAAIVIQLQKKNPVNLRSILGVKPGINPKAMGLFLKSYSLMAHRDQKYLEKAENIFQWLSNNYSTGSSGKCWGYNFDWVNPTESIPKYMPSVVVTSFVIDGIYEYFNLTKSERAKEIIQSSVNYIINDIPVTCHGPDELSFAYTTQTKGSCYNASLLAAEILAKADNVSGTSKYFELVQHSVNFVARRQRKDGAWFYSYNDETGTERDQIDFHQGFVLVSLDNLIHIYPQLEGNVSSCVKKGMEFYANQQFATDGRAKWRLPKEYPTDIHNQTQGIITFARLSASDSKYYEFTKTIAEYTIDHFFDKKGYFYYRRNRLFTNKIPYMRWAQAWMHLALVELLRTMDE